MATHVVTDINNFCSGHMIVNQEREIVFCNAYIGNLNGRAVSTLTNLSLSSCFSKASNIFIDSYIYPLLLIETAVQEIQLSWVNQQKKVIPVVVNIRIGEDGKSYWSIYECTNRDKLHSELIKMKEKLEEQSKELYQLAITDPLTGLMNRRELQKQITRAINHISRNPSTFALLSIDIDFFKRVNDTHGHQEGDKALIHLANILKEKRRTNDIVARVGGEEFVLLLSDINEEDAYKLAESLRKKVKQESVNDIYITISIGVVVSNEDEKRSADELLKLSDDALYSSKNTGRNKTTVAQY